MTESCIEFCNSDVKPYCHISKSLQLDVRILGWGILHDCFTVNMDFFLYSLCTESIKKNVYKKGDYENEQTTPGTTYWKKLTAKKI